MNSFRRFCHLLFSKFLITTCHPQYWKRHHQANNKVFELSFYIQKTHRFSSAYFPSKRLRDMQFNWMLCPLSPEVSCQISKIARNLCLGTDSQGDRMPPRNPRSLIPGGESCTLVSIKNYMSFSIQIQ